MQPKGYVAESPANNPRGGKKQAAHKKIVSGRDGVVDRIGKRKIHRAGGGETEEDSTPGKRNRKEVLSKGNCHELAEVAMQSRHQL